MLTPKRLLSTIAGRPLAACEREMRSLGGLAESEQHALIVSPQSRPSTWVVTMTTPAASMRIAALNPSASTAGFASSRSATSVSM